MQQQRPWADEEPPDDVALAAVAVMLAADSKAKVGKTGVRVADGMLAKPDATFLQGMKTDEKARQFI